MKTAAASSHVGAMDYIKTSDLLELIGFVVIVLLPLVVSSFAPPASPELSHRNLYSTAGFVKTLFKSLEFGLVAGFLLARKDPGFSWLKPGPIKIPVQILAGISLWFAYYLFFDFWGTVAGLAKIHTPSVAWLHPETGNEAVPNGLFSFVNGTSEEIMRVYLLGQTRRVGLGSAKAALLVAALMTSYHFYQGAFTVVAFVLCHIILNRFYLSTRALPALIVWHVLSDFMHSTDLVGWQFVSQMVNGSVCVAVLAISKILSH